MNRRNFVKLAAAAALVPGARPVFAAQDTGKITVYKDPNCGCCAAALPSVGQIAPKMQADRLR